MKDHPNSDLEGNCPLGPPRPRAIVTFLASDDHAPGAQTLLYSLKQNLSSASGGYPPEIVVVVTPTVSQEVRDALCPILCTRVIEVNFIPMPKKKAAGSDEDEGKNEDEDKNEQEGATTASHVSA